MFLGITDEVGMPKIQSENSQNEGNVRQRCLTKNLSEIDLHTKSEATWPRKKVLLMVVLYVLASRKTVDTQMRPHGFK